MSNSENEHKANKRELIAVGILTVLLAFMDISGMPCSLFMSIEVRDIEPIYWSLMLNFVIIGIIAFLVLRCLCPSWKLGLGKEGLAAGFKKYGVAGVMVGIISGIAFFIGLQPFDYKPTIWKVLIEGIVYYFGVAIVEELYVRGLLLNFIEKLFITRENKTAIAIISSSVIFGVGHVFGVLGQSFLVIVAKVIWKIAMGLYFGVIYKKTENLWLPIILHFIINICALPYCYTTMQGYSDISLYIILPTYILLGVYSLYAMKRSRQIPVCGGENATYYLVRE